jgi:hypothetical protein
VHANLLRRRGALPLRHPGELTMKVMFVLYCAVILAGLALAFAVGVTGR